MTDELQHLQSSTYRVSFKRENIQLLCDDDATFKFEIPCSDKYSFNFNYDQFVYYKYELGTFLLLSRKTQQYSVGNQLPSEVEGNLWRIFGKSRKELFPASVPSCRVPQKFYTAAKT